MGTLIQTNKFKTIGDDGKYYSVIEYAEWARRQNFMHEPHGDALGIRQYELDDGSVVTRTGPAEFLILISDVKLTLIT